MWLDPAFEAIDAGRARSPAKRDSAPGYPPDEPERSHVSGSVDGWRKDGHG
jgi:hypothetical protein